MCECHFLFLYFLPLWILKRQLQVCLNGKETGMNGALKGCDLRAGQKERYINLSVRDINLPELGGLLWSISISIIFFLKHFYKVPQPAHLSWKWCFYLELIFPNTVSVSMICSYRLLREMWSHRKNSDISMTFSAEREKEIISLSFVLFFFKFNEDLEMERKEGERAFCPQTGFS